MTSLNRSGNKILELSLDEIIELEQKKNESARQANLAALRGEKNEQIITDGDEKTDKNGINKQLPEDITTQPVSNNAFSRRYSGQNKSMQRNRVRKPYAANYYKAGVFSGYQNFYQRNRNQSYKKPQKRRQEVTATQWAYLHHLRSVRNSQGFSLIGGQSPLTRYRTSTPNGSLIYPLTRTFLKSFDSSHSNSRISLMSLGSTARSNDSVRSFRSTCPTNNSFNSQRSFTSDKPAASLCDEEGVADEIALIQSSLVDNPNYDKILQTNRQPLTSLSASSTNLSLSSRFSTYYDPPE